MQSSLYSQYLHLKHRQNQTPQTLWNGCGTLEKCQIGTRKYAIKISQVPDDLQHVNIQQTSFSLQRKIKSYVKEQHFYRHYALCLRDLCLLPQAIELHEINGKFITLLEDFEPLGFQNKSSVSTVHIKRVLDWLATFHANWLTEDTDNDEFETFGYGNYWHLDTRPDEYQKMPNSALKESAHKIDKTLKRIRYHTLIHGDAKLANFAFDDNRVIGYDFQHVGLGNGLSDVMLLFTTVLNNAQLETECNDLLAYYFSRLQQALVHKCSAISFCDLQQQWQESWCFIWADFHRFLQGWRPEHPKINDYMKKQTAIALRQTEK
ncbi:phosphotransferase [Pseudoalteromonas luteoviolacea]|uniref:phosphotransferase n=1 Tax=Pseudoalteromonas luteoviolacea TaxID=43657 RepID=UPI001B37FA79|nr:phosphotransferase [Pseudoalteromonas luteoviolacea]MBQ4875857.1 phosphotransferase [Pseudoalteromonas luteoviolacea]MBQ4904892.1 phosphotransferase [Pseudoalteromonas luteoviolacea]